MRSCCAPSWTAPDGSVAQEETVEEFSGPFIGSVLKFRGGAPAGTWIAELRLGEDMVDRRTVEVRAR